jgi:hypothetical protein
MDYTFYFILFFEVLANWKPRKIVWRTKNETRNRIHIDNLKEDFRIRVYLTKLYIVG